MTRIHRNGIQCFLILLIAMGSLGCQSAGKRATGQSLGRDSNLFGRVNPTTLHQALSPEKLAQMTQGQPQELDDLSFLDDDYKKVTLPRRPEKSSPVAAEKAYLRGRWALRQDDATAAAEEFANSLAADPNQPDVILAYAQTLFALQKVDACRDWLLYLYHLGADSTKAYAYLGDLYRIAEQPERAMALYDYALRQHDATEANPQTLMTNIRAGNLLAEQGYLAAAVEHYETAWQLLRRHESYSQTDRTFSQLIRQFHQPLLQLADWKLQLGDIAGAVETLDGIQQHRSWEIIAFFIQMQTRSSLPREIRERRVEALVRYLLAEDKDAFVAIRLFNEACKQMAMQSACDDAIARWSLPESSRPLLLGDRAYAYALQLADKVHEAEAVLRRALNRAEKPSLELTLDLAGLLGRYERWEEMVAVLAERVETLDNPCDAALWEFLGQQAPRIPLKDLMSGQGITTGTPFSRGQALVYGVLCLQKQSYELGADLMRKASRR